MEIVKGTGKRKGREAEFVRVSENNLREIVDFIKLKYSDYCGFITSYPEVSLLVIEETADGDILQQAEAGDFLEFVPITSEYSAIYIHERVADIINNYNIEIPGSWRDHG